MSSALHAISSRRGGCSAVNRFRCAFVVCSIVLASVITYAPAVDNAFISDDFGVFPLLEALEQRPSYIFDATSELFRVTSYIYFWVCFKLIGLSSAVYYAAGIAIHALISLLVYMLVLRVSGRVVAAWPAALFFAVYERHQEAIMWISAVNEMILTLFCVLFLLLWHRILSQPVAGRIHAILAIIVLTFAFFSKEAAVALVPIAVVMVRWKGHSWREVLDRSIPVVSLLAAFGVLWLSQADRNFFVTDGHYALGLHFFPVYARAVLRLISPAIPFLAALLLLKHRGAESVWNGSFAFFVMLLLAAIAPYCFLTYLDHLPSRHTYFPSVGLAGILGISFAGVRERLKSVRAKQVSIAYLLVLLIGNGGYIWLKKEPQYQERAAPTRELFQMLNSDDLERSERPIYICGFALHEPWWFSDAVSRFTSFPPQEIVLLKECSYPAERTALIWDQVLERYVNPIQPTVLTSQGPDSPRD